MVGPNCGIEQIAQNVRKKTLAYVLAFAVLPLSAHADVWFVGTEYIGKVAPSGEVLYFSNSVFGEDFQLNVGFYDCIGADQRTGSVWVSDVNNNRVFKLDARGKPMFQVDLFSPFAIGVDPANGAAWTSIPLNRVDFSRAIVNLDPNTGAELARVTGFDRFISSIAVSDSGDIWVSERNRNEIVVLSGSIEDLDGYDASSPLGEHHRRISGISSPQQIDINPPSDPDGPGTIWVGGGRYAGVTKIAPNGAILANSIPTGFPDGEVRGVSVNSRNGNFWVTGLPSSALAKLSRSGEELLNAGFPTGYPRAVSVDMTDEAAWVVWLDPEPNNGWQDTLVKLDSNGSEILRIPGLGQIACLASIKTKETRYRLEAEDLQLETFNVESLNSPFDVELINLKGPGTSGSAVGTFPGVSGRYDIFVAYHDENDGEAQITTIIDGNTVDTWTLDQVLPRAEQATESNRFDRQVAADYAVKNGDEIRINALQGGWDNANIDYIEFVLAEPQPMDTVRVEAEAMDLDTYRVEMLDFASNGALINLKGPGLNGSATTAFSGNSGKYDVVVVYHDENDGVAQLTVSIAGISIDSWTLDYKSTEAQPKPANRLARQIATDLTVNAGDTIRIDGLQGNWDHANVDYIDFVVKEPPQSTVQIEAEDMRLYTYRVETLDFASDGALINLKGPGLNGSVSAAFPGNSGKYDITVVYHDENDGVAQLFVTIAGVAVDSWLLDFRSTEAQAKPANRRVREIATGYTVNNGDEIRIDGLQGNWDHANVDYIKFVAVP